MLSLTACDELPENSEFTGSPPVLSGFVFTPDFVDLTVADKNVDGDAVITLVASVSVNDPDVDLDKVVLTITSPLLDKGVIVSSELVSATGSQFSISEEVVLPAAELGIYTVRIVGYDNAANLSNQVRGNLLFTSTTGSAPSIDNFEAFPETITPPGTLVMVATASDPDGLANILSVLITTPNNQEFEMFDDGVSSGDATAGDGRFTATFDVPAGVAPGVQTFSVKAVDRSGLESNVVEKDVTIQ